MSCLWYRGEEKGMRDGQGLWEEDRKNGRRVGQVGGRTEGRKEGQTDGRTGKYKERLGGISKV